MSIHAFRGPSAEDEGVEVDRLSRALMASARQLAEAYREEDPRLNGQPLSFVVVVGHDGKGALIPYQGDAAFELVANGAPLHPNWAPS